MDRKTEYFRSSVRYSLKYRGKSFFRIKERGHKEEEHILNVIVNSLDFDVSGTDQELQQFC